MKNLLKTSIVALAFATTGFMSTNALADQVFADDVIVQGSLCVGIDCVNGENFGFDTIRLKENNLRIHFDDTSNSASFPANDWRIVANDTSNGGADYLAFEDSTAGTVPFRVLAGAGNHALYVNSNGNVGLGTSTPAVQFQITDGNTPTVRLDQDGSSGFTPQVWDVAGNEANFFVRNVTNGSRLPLRIFPDARGDGLTMKGDNVGFGTTTPSNLLHAKSPSGNAALTLESGNNPTGGKWSLVARSNDGEFAINDDNTSGADFIFKTSDTGANTAWEFVHRPDEGLGINIASSVGADLILSNTGNLTVLGTITSGGPTCGGGCDAVFDEDYVMPSIEDHAAEMFANKYLPAVGPTLPKEPMNVSEKMGDMLNELEKAHIYIVELNERNKQLEARLAKLEAAQ